MAQNVPRNWSSLFLIPPFLFIFYFLLPPCQCMDPLSPPHNPAEMAMHSSERPFHCAHCAFRSITKGNLDQHMRAVHRQLLPQAAPGTIPADAPVDQAAAAAPVSAGATQADALPAAH
jgi:hypothetical protein